MKKGSIIKVQNFTFLDGFEDIENYNRNCIFLFNVTKEDGRYLCVCPITERISSFNLNPHEYYLLPFSNENGKKFFFAKLSSIVYIRKQDVIKELGNLPLSDFIRMLKKLKDNYINYQPVEYFEEIVNKIEERNMGVK